MKKFLSLLLAAIMLLSCVSAMAEDDPEWKINEFTGLVSRESAAEKLDSIVVPAEVDGIAVRGIEYMAFNMHKNFKQLTDADNAAMLDRRVLRDLLKLEAVELSENLLIIREGNFTNLPKLTSVVVPASVVLVHSSFNKCASLTSITFEGMCPVFVTAGTFGMFTELPADCVIYVPDNQVSAYKAAFADREDVVARIQPSGKNAERIDRPASENDFVFDASTGTITSYTGSADYLVIPATIDGVQVKHIGDFAFETNVCCIIIPEGVETIGRYSLGRELVSYVSLPSTLTNVGSGAFASSYLSAIAYPAAAVPAYEAAAFESVKSDAWQLILPYGTTQEQVDAFAAYIAPSAPKAVVKASIIEPYSFPKLDAEAGAPFIGNWTAVAVTDGTDFYGMDLLGISMTAVLNDDGAGVVDMDGDATPGGWYVENGAAVFAPILEEGGQPVPEEAMSFMLDENGRMTLDLGGLVVLLEEEGAVYAVPAIPEKPWPAFSLDDVKYFVGSWEAVSYTMGEETYDAAMIGPMVLTLKEDGTAISAESEEETYELTWCQGDYYGTALVGETYRSAAELSFDGNGNIKMEQDGVVILLAPKKETPKAELAIISQTDRTSVADGKRARFIVEAVGDGLTYAWYYKRADAADFSLSETYTDNTYAITMNEARNGMQIYCIITDQYGNSVQSDTATLTLVADKSTSELVGDWYDDLGNKLSINADGSMKYTYASDGWVDTYAWDMVDGAAEVTEGYWAGASIYKRDGIVFIDNDEGIFQLFSVDGDLSAYYGEEDEYDYDMPEAQPIGPEGEPYFGTWTMDLGGMAMNLILNQDGTCAMEMMGETEPGVWTMEDGKAYVMGDEITIDGNGNLVITSAGMAFTKTDGNTASGEGAAQPMQSDDPYIGKKFVLVGASINGINLSAEQLNAAGDYVIFNADGSVELFMSDRFVETLGWTRGKVSVVGAEHDGFCVDYYGTYYNFGITGDGLMLDYFGTPRFYEPEVKEETAVPAASEAAAPAQTAAAGLDAYMNKKYVAKTYTAAGFTADASMLGAEYALTLKADGTCELITAGYPVLLKWSQEQDRLAIDYMGAATYYATPNAAGLDLEMNGMVLGMVAE